MIQNRLNKEVVKGLYASLKKSEQKTMNEVSFGEKIFKLSKHLAGIVFAFILEAKVLDGLVVKNDEDLMKYIGLILTSFTSFCMVQKLGEGRYFLKVLFIKFIFKFIMMIYMRYDISLKSFY